MAQYDIYENTDSSTRSTKPYLLDVQSDLLQTFSTRVVVPLIPAANINRPVEILNPVIRVLNKNHYVSSSEINCVSLNTMGRKVAHVSIPQQACVQKALGFLIECD